MHKSIVLIVLAVLIFSSSNTLLAQDSVSDQINMAVFAAPEEHRDGAKVLGFDKEGNVITLREGTNDFICLADNPASARFHVSCYKKTLEPFMERGRALSAEGRIRAKYSRLEKRSKRRDSSNANRTGYVIRLFGDDVTYDAETNTVEGAQYRYSIYIPFATQESTGLPLRPNAPGHPWLMDPGTHRAHIMITPPAENN